MTTTDELTQILNKRALLEALEREISRARGEGDELSVVMVNIDLFRQLNDRYGHIAGDYLLRELAQVVQKRIRRDEIFGRIGGEEFAIVLPRTAIGVATALAESVRSHVEQHEFTFQGERIALTISLGCAQMTAAQSAQELLMLAEQKVREAKLGGRNRVCA